jgi:hypothetical protein
MLILQFFILGIITNLLRLYIQDFTNFNFILTAYIGRVRIYLSAWTLFDLIPVF